MDFKQLEAFVKVIEHASFSKAADAIFMSQPSVSMYVNALEKELGTTLINRSTKEVSPTLAGKIFYENTKELLALKYNATERIKNLTGNLKGTISILASSVPAQYILPVMLSDFNLIYPDISFAIKQADSLGVSRGIASQKAEIGFSGGIVDNDKCAYEKFMPEQMVLIAPPNKEISETETYTLEGLLYSQRFIAREEGSATKVQYENFFTSAGIDPKLMNISACFDNTQSVINAVISGLGISMVSGFAAAPFIAHKMVMSIKIDTQLPERNFYYLLKKNFTHSHLVDLFVEFLKEK